MVSMGVWDKLRSQRGMQAKLARDLGITRGAVGKWTRIPEDRLIEVERITGIPRNKLRPDLYIGWKRADGRSCRVGA